VQKRVNSLQKEKQTKHSGWSMIKETLRWPIKLLLSNQARALDGAIDGAIFFPDCVIRVRFFC